MIAKAATDSTRLDHMKPLQTTHHITQIAGNQAGPAGGHDGIDQAAVGVGVRFEDFTTRVRGSGKVDSFGFCCISLANTATDGPNYF